MPTRTPTMRAVTCTTHALLPALVVLLVAVSGGSAAVHNYKNGHHHPDHQHHHQQHHQPHHTAYHGPRAARTRREKNDFEEAPDSESPYLNPEGTAHPDVGTINCTVGGTECATVTNSECNRATLQCSCPVAYPIHDYENKYCVRESKLNATCQFNSQCEETDPNAMCGSNRICVCKEEYSMDEFPNVGLSCVESSNTTGVDPAMIGVLAGLALMFVIICVVLRLFSKARFRENRSIFNTPNPRLMNASLFKDIGVSGRRGSTMSAVSGTGSAAGAKTPSPSKKKSSETTVAIETVD